MEQLMHGIITTTERGIKGSWLTRAMAPIDAVEMAQGWGPYADSVDIVPCNRDASGCDCESIYGVKFPRSQNRDAVGNPGIGYELEAMEEYLKRANR